MALTPIALIPQVVLGGLLVPMTLHARATSAPSCRPCPRAGASRARSPPTASRSRPTRRWLIDLGQTASRREFIEAGKFKCAIAQMASDSQAGAWGFTTYDQTWMPYAVLGGMTVVSSSWWSPSSSSGGIRCDEAPTTTLAATPLALGGGRGPAASSLAARRPSPHAALRAAGRRLREPASAPRARRPSPPARTEPRQRSARRPYQGRAPARRQGITLPKPTNVLAARLPARGAEGGRRGGEGHARARHRQGGPRHAGGGPEPGGARLRRGRDRGRQGARVRARRRGRRHPLRGAHPLRYPSRSPAGAAPPPAAPPPSRRAGDALRRRARGRQRRAHRRRRRHPLARQATVAHRREGRLRLRATSRPASTRCWSPRPGYTPLERRGAARGGRGDRGRSIASPRQEAARSRSRSRASAPRARSPSAPSRPTEIERIPGTNGDALKSIQNLPGVARPPALLGLLIVRGSAPQDTQTFVDGTPVPLIYHFGGLSSVVPTEVLDEDRLLPGQLRHPVRPRPGRHRRRRPARPQDRSTTASRSSTSSTPALCSRGPSPASTAGPSSRRAAQLHRRLARPRAQSAGAGVTRGARLLRLPVHRGQEADADLQLPRSRSSGRTTPSSSCSTALARPARARRQTSDFHTAFQRLQIRYTQRPRRRRPDRGARSPFGRTSIELRASAPSSSTSTPSADQRPRRVHEEARQGASRIDAGVDMFGGFYDVDAAAPPAAASRASRRTVPSPPAPSSTTRASRAASSSPRPTWRWR